MTEGHGLSRRAFVSGAVAFLGGIIGLVLALPAIGYLLSPVLKKAGFDTEEWIPLGPVGELETGKPHLFTFSRTRRVGWETTGQSFGIYVVKKPDGGYDVFSNVCTHLSCRVTWEEDRDMFVCPCHSGFFALDGGVISGPQPRPLDQYDYVVEEGILKIHLAEV
ncbi:MAG: ubiquinol-cytochrome c reductase iron-sulfur subunit [Anaerolineales bacterium]|nr:ubiquinol-cytochrome c reductase iron-sulfur subunit [Anaerolineales bacterium]